METLLLLLAALSLGTASCTHSSNEPATPVADPPAPTQSVAPVPTEEPTPSPTVVASSTPSPSPSASPEVAVVVTVDQTINFSDAELAVLNQALADMNQVLNTACFLDGVLAAPFVETQNMTNLEIYDDVMGQGTGKIVLNVTLYYSWWDGYFDGTYGYTYLGDTMTYINTYFWGNAEVLASTLTHEHSHTLNFTHNGGPADVNSVPYSLNRIFDSCYAQLNP
jgi:hypothetical protein